MLDADPKFAKLLYSSTTTPSRALTLENIKLHQQQLSQNNFTHKLMNIIHNRNFNSSDAKTVTHDYQHETPIFDALIELEEDSLKDHFMDHVLNFHQIEQDFRKIHQLIDKLYQNEDDLEPQNSYLF